MWQNRRRLTTKRGKKLLSTTKNRKMWRAMIAHTLKGRGTHMKKIYFNNVFFLKQMLRIRIQTEGKKSLQLRNCSPVPFEENGFVKIYMAFLKHLFLNKVNRLIENLIWRRWAPLSYLKGSRGRRIKVYFFCHQTPPSTIEVVEG